MHEITMRSKWHFTQESRLFWKSSPWPVFFQYFHHLLPLGRLIPFSVVAKSLMLKQGLLFLCLCSTKSLFFSKQRTRDVYARKINHSGTLFLLTFEVVVFWGWMLKQLPSNRFAIWRNGMQHDCFLLTFCFLYHWQPNNSSSRGLLLVLSSSMWKQGINRYQLRKKSPKLAKNHGS